MSKIYSLKEHVSILEMEVQDIKSSLQELIELVREMNKGLYGDSKNNQMGVIERQKHLESEIKTIHTELDVIKKKLLEKDISNHVRKNYKSEIITLLRYFLVTVVNIVVIIAILKGLIGIDALLNSW